MENPKGLKLIDKMLKDLPKSGINKGTLVKNLKELRPYAIDEKDPTLTRVIRLTYEHLEEVGTFEIPIPEDELVEEGEGEEVEVAPVTGVESMEYLLAIMKDAQNHVNRVDLMEYRDTLLAELD